MMMMMMVIQPSTLLALVRLSTTFPFVSLFLCFFVSLIIIIFSFSLIFLLLVPFFFFLLLCFLSFSCSNTIMVCLATSSDL